MQAIIKILHMMEELFAGECDAFEMSFDLPKYLCDHFDEIEAFNHELAYYLNDTVPDICDEGEPCFDPTHMNAELKKVYDKIKQMIKKL